MVEHYPQILASEEEATTTSLTEEVPKLCALNTVEPMMKDTSMRVSYLVGALSPVIHNGLYQS